MYDVLEETGWTLEARRVPWLYAALVRPRPQSLEPELESLNVNLNARAAALW